VLLTAFMTSPTLSKGEAQMWRAGYGRSFTSATALVVVHYTARVFLPRSDAGLSNLRTRDRSPAGEQ